MATYTNGRGGVFDSLVKKIQNVINPTSKTSTIKLPSNASVKGANIPKPTANTQPNRGYVAPAPRPTLSTTQANTAFTSRMPNQSVPIQGPTSSGQSFNGSFTPNRNDFSFQNVLRGFQNNQNSYTNNLPLNKLSNFNLNTPNLGLNPLSIFSAAASVVPRSVRQRVGQGLEDISGLASGIPVIGRYDSGLSEFVAGGPTRRSGMAYADSGKQKGATIETSNINTTTSKNKSQNQSRVNMSSKAANDALKNQQIQDEANKLNTGISSYNNQIASDNGNLIDDGSIYGWENEVNDLYNQEYESLEQFQQAQADLQRKQEEEQFNALKGSYESQIPFLENQVNTQVADQSANLQRLERDSNAAKVEEENTYGDMIKRLVQNANASKVKLGNVFSGLGTVDSSSFQNQLGQVERTQLEGIGDYERDMGKNISGITTRLMDAKRETESLITQIKNEGNAKKQAVMNQINASAVDKNRAISEINQQLAQAIMDAKQFYTQKQADLLTNKGTLLQNEYALGNQYNRDLGLQNNEYANMLKLQQSVGNTIAPEAEQALKGYVVRKGKSSSPELAQLIASLGIDPSTAYSYISKM